jgi:hypothetical protein
MKVGQDPMKGTREIIRAAERHIEAHEYALAIEKLGVALRLDPDNMYINAIIERVHRLVAEDSGQLRYLGVTVGTQFENGIKPSNDAAQSGEDLEASVRKLTKKASELVRRGAYETAFDSLMSAYLLDPISPLVIECEKVVLPALEKTRKLGTTNGGSQAMNPTAPTPPSNRVTESARVRAEEQARLETLKQQKESERMLHEREMWREASRPPRMLDNLLEADFPKPEGEVQPPSQEKNHTGFFAKLRHGRFLG